MRWKKLKRLVQFLVDILGLGFLHHQIVHDVVNPQIQFLNSFFTIFSPEIQKRKIKKHYLKEMRWLYYLASAVFNLSVNILICFL